MKNRYWIKTTILLISTIWIGCGPTERPPEAASAAMPVVEEAEWVSLWDGETLDGWHEIGDGQWAIEDSTIVGRQVPDNPEYGHLVTNERYDDFEIRLEYRAVSGNSGLYFRSDTTGFSGVSGFQAEIDATKDAGGLYETNGRSWVVQPDSADVEQWFKPGEWNEMTVRAEGGNVVVHVNGMQSAEVTNDEGRRDGFFALQVHGGQEVEVAFRDIEIRKLN